MKPLTIKPTLDLTGGESVYCINEVQRKKTLDMFSNAAETSKLKEMYRMVNNDLDRNERAALAFMIIENLTGKNS